MIKTIQILCIAALFSACAQEQQRFSHLLTDSEGIEDAQFYYIPAGTVPNDSTQRYDLPAVQQALTIERLDDGLYTLVVEDNNGLTSFDEIPSKFINMDATVEISRNVFKAYFPEEWAPIKGSKYTSILLRSQEDEGKFYIKTVITGTNKEIGKHSEDY